jgi:hypothetical protein
MFNTQEVNRLMLRYVTMIITTKGIACPVWLLMVKPILNRSGYPTAMARDEFLVRFKY